MATVYSFSEHDDDLHEFIRELTGQKALKGLDHETLLVSLADKVHNARSILRDLRKPEVGQGVWARFNNPREETLWYYRELARVRSLYLGYAQTHLQQCDLLTPIQQ